MPTGTHKLDAFESLFRSAVKDVFHYAPPTIERALLITDLGAEASAALQKKVATFLATIDHAHSLTWEILGEEQWVTGKDAPIPALIEMVNDRKPDLIVTARHLLGKVKDLPHTLGSAVDVVTQATAAAVLLLPPLDREDFDSLLGGTERVMVVTDHLTGDDRIVNMGVHFTHRNGTVYLAHVEDDAALQHILDVIAKLPDLDSELADKSIRAKLLQLPTDYIATISGVLEKNDVQETIVPVVRTGHALTDYKRLVEEHEIDLLIVNTKDDSQLAMHALAHALAVEIRHRPLLLL